MIVEYSENRQRGDMPHIRKAIEALRGATARSVACARCRTGRATHLIDAFRSPRAVCERCAGDWSALSALERRQAATFSRRDGR
jgi:hypothetical protein